MKYCCRIDHIFLKPKVLFQIFNICDPCYIQKMCHLMTAKDTLLL